MLYKLTIYVAEESRDLAEGLIANLIQHGWEEGQHNELIVHCEEKKKLEELENLVQEMVPAARFEWAEVEEKDWLAAWRVYFTPIEAGKFVVLPPWLAAETFAGKMPILIEPKSAFGTGHHATTALCLHALSLLAEKNRIQNSQTFFDLGTGTGILGIAATMLGLQGEGSDIDDLSILNAHENIALNSAKNFHVEHGSYECAHGKTYNLVLANILARPLIEMAPEVCKLLAPTGTLVLSGILEEQATSVEQAYNATLAGNAWKFQRYTMADFGYSVGTPSTPEPEILDNDHAPLPPETVWVALVWELQK